MPSRHSENREWHRPPGLAQDVALDDLVRPMQCCLHPGDRLIVIKPQHPVDVMAAHVKKGAGVSDQNTLELLISSLSTKVHGIILAGPAAIGAQVKDDIIALHRRHHRLGFGH